MKKNVLLVTMFSLFSFISVAYAWSYPVKQVTWNFCEQTWAACTIDIPRIEWANYLAYQNSPRYRSIYTVMWWWTYYDWWDFWFWSHQGVDIASTLWTPITAMWDGEVVEAEEKWDWWKTIVIKHTVWWSILRSVYAHLDEMLVKVWDQVKEWDLIAKMWKSWNATGIHVHFQIDISEWKHPYFPSWCDDSLTDKVNEWKCWEKVRENTLDPILFLETDWAIFLAERNSEVQIRESDYLSVSDLKLQLWTTVFKQGASTKLTVTPKKEGVDAFLKDDLSIVTTTGLSVSANRISYIWTWRDVLVVWNKSGLYKMSIKSWNSLVKKYNIFVLSEEMITTLRKKFPDNKVIQEILDNL
jgi:hypothetical protein